MSTEKKNKTTPKNSKEVKATKKEEKKTKTSKDVVKTTEVPKTKTVKSTKTVKETKSKTIEATAAKKKATNKVKSSIEKKPEAIKQTQEKAVEKTTKNKNTTKTKQETKKKKVKSIKNTNPKFVAVGRRKTAVARVFMQKGSGIILVNDKELKIFSPNRFLNYKILQPLELIKGVKDFDINVNVSGGGQAAQVEAIRLGISRCLLKFDVSYRPALKDLGYLTRDPRMVERKKFGHKKARRSFQFSKR